MSHGACARCRQRNFRKREVPRLFDEPKGQRVHRCVRRGIFVLRHGFLPHGGIHARELLRIGEAALGALNDRTKAKLNYAFTFGEDASAFLADKFSRRDGVESMARLTERCFRLLSEEKLRRAEKDGEKTVSGTLGVKDGVLAFTFPDFAVTVEEEKKHAADPKAAEEWQALKEKEAVARQRKKEREEERMAADPEYAAMMAERKAEYTRTRTAKRQAEREALVELAKTDEEAAKKLAEMRKYQSQATVRSYQKMKADAEAGDPDAIKRYETTLAKRREEYHRKKGA